MYVFDNVAAFAGAAIYRILAATIKKAAANTFVWEMRDLSIIAPFLFPFLYLVLRCKHKHLQADCQLYFFIVVEISRSNLHR